MKKPGYSMLAFRQMFQRATSVRCLCGYDLTGYKDLYKLTRCGCPACGSKTFHYTFADDDLTMQNIAARIGGQPPCTQS